MVEQTVIYRHVDYKKSLKTLKKEQWKNNIYKQSSFGRVGQGSHPESMIINDFNLPTFYEYEHYY